MKPVSLCSSCTCGMKLALITQGTFFTAVLALLQGCAQILFVFYEQNANTGFITFTLPMLTLRASADQFQSNLLQLEC